MSYRVWVIGLDGATFDLISPWVDAGLLPTFARLMKEGAWGELQSTIPPVTGPAWSTFMTGTNPGMHSIFDWVYRRPGSYDFSPVTAESCTRPSLWQIASHKGKRVLAINIPMTYPPEPVNGLLVSGLPGVKLATHPKELAADILSNLPGYIVYPDPGRAYSQQGIDAFLAQLDQAIDQRQKLWTELIKRSEWDFAMMVFNATDVVQHAMWKYMRREHAHYNPQNSSHYENSIFNIYRRMDLFLGELLEEITDDTALWIMSDHGFGPLHCFIHVNTWLLQEGFLKLKPNAQARLKRNLFQLGISPMRIYDFLMRIGLGRFKRAVVRGQGRSLLKALFLSFSDVDWHRTKAYSFGNIGQIRINVCGREPQGIIEAGEEFENTVVELISRLRRLRDPSNNLLVIENIYRKEEIYHGAAMQNAADILFIPRKLEYFGFGEYEFGDNRVFAPITRGISGTHRMNGILIGWGQPIQSIKIHGAKLEDLAPTFLHLMGLQIPEHMDGRPLTECLSHRADLPQPEYGPAWEDKDKINRGLDADDEAILRERLKDLGYVA